MSLWQVVRGEGDGCKPWVCTGTMNKWLLAEVNMVNDTPYPLKLLFLKRLMVSLKEPASLFAFSPSN